MADIALGGVGRIVEVALKIKEAVETVKQNEKECRGIQTCVARVTALLKRLDETTETMKDEVTRDTLDDLAKSLERALELVTECQRKHIFRRFLGAGDMAKELGRVQDDIVRKLQLGNFATIVQATIMLTNIHSAGAPRSPPPPPPEEVVPGFKRFSLSELKVTTDDFSDENRIGSGGSAKVYKGVLHGGQVVAIKEIRGMLLCENQKRPYDEINVFLELKHKNIVRPLGYCHEITMVLTSYRGKYVGAKYQRFCYVEEYMPYGSMENIIKGSRRIDWSSRFRIIRGIAQGVHYLHEQRVVHLDLKPRNILFDSDMNPRIGDFGVANKTLDHGEDEITRDDDSIVGTVRYMAPEYIGEGILSTKCDVYAFGITLLETVSSMCKSKQPDINALAGWASMAQEAGHTEDLFDPSLCDKSQLTEIKRCVEVGLLCVQYDRKERPTMEMLLPHGNGQAERTAWLPAWCYHPLSDEVTVGFLTKVMDASVMGLVTLNTFSATYLLAWGKPGSTCISKPKDSSDSKDSSPSWVQVLIASLPFAVFPITLFVSGLVQAAEKDGHALGIVATFCLIEFIVAIILEGGMTVCMSGASWKPIAFVTLLLIVLMVVMWGFIFKHPKMKTLILFYLPCV